MSDTDRALRVLRAGILAIVVLGTIGMSTELVLIGHFEDATQVIPLALGALALVVIAWVAVRPGLVAFRALQLVMLLFIGAGITGIAVHFNANAEFQREIDPSIGGAALFWKVVEATAPPALAPGVMVQLGLLGLVYTYRHPVLGAEPFDEFSPGDHP
jgi:hypothetical protein